MEKQVAAAKPQFVIVQEADNGSVRMVRLELIREIVFAENNDVRLVLDDDGTDWHELNPIHHSVEGKWNLMEHFISLGLAIDLRVCPFKAQMERGENLVPVGTMRGAM